MKIAMDFPVYLIGQKFILNAISHKEADNIIAKTGVDKQYLTIYTYDHKETMNLVNPKPLAVFEETEDKYFLVLASEEVKYDVIRGINKNQPALIVVELSSNKVYAAYPEAFSLKTFGDTWQVGIYLKTQPNYYGFVYNPEIHRHYADVDVAGSFVRTKDFIRAFSEHIKREVVKN